MKPREFISGDLVLQKVIGSMKDWNAGKLTMNWEGTYRVTTTARMGAYYLEDMEEQPLPRHGICVISRSFTLR